MMLDLLARASLEGALLAAAVWVVARALPRLSPAVRALLWWCVAAKFILAMLGVGPIAVPVLPANTTAVPTAAATGTEHAPTDSPARTPTIAAGTAPPAVHADRFPVSWTMILATLWGIGLSVCMVRTLRRWQETRRVVSRSVPADPSLHDVVRELATLLTLRRTADIRLSSEIESPLITGVRAPVILVPASRFPQLTPDQQRMALCHELAHMKRGDLWLGLVPAAVEQFFFFHPLARLAAREYAFWREAACDEAVLRALGASPQCYGRLLLALGVSRQSVTFSAAGAAWSFSNLKRRITMLSHPSSPTLRGRVLATGVVALTVLAIAPVKAVARSASPAVPAFTVPRADAVPAPVTPASAAGDSSSSATSDLHAAAPTVERAASTVVPTQERVARAQERRRTEELQFVYFNGDRNTISGSSGDVARARRYRRSGEPLLWFRRDGQEYVVRDAAMLREVEELWEPVGRVGEEQGKVGAQQGAIGAEQGKHGARLGEIGARQGLVGAKQGVVGARLGVLAARESLGLTPSERREVERERESLDREMRELGRQMEALSREMRQVDPPMRDLGDDMSVLGRQMETLGRKMEEASRRADTGMRALIERAVRSRAAEPVR